MITSLVKRAGSSKTAEQRWALELSLARLYPNALGAVGLRTALDTPEHVRQARLCSERFGVRHLGRARLMAYDRRPARLDARAEDGK